MRYKKNAILVNDNQIEIASKIKWVFVVEIRWKMSSASTYLWVLTWNEVEDEEIQGETSQCHRSQEVEILDPLVRNFANMLSDKECQLFGILNDRRNA